MQCPAYWYFPASGLPPESPALLAGKWRKCPLRVESGRSSPHIGSPPDTDRKYCVPVQRSLLVPPLFLQALPV